MTKTLPGAVFVILMLVFFLLGAFLILYLYLNLNFQKPINPLISYSPVTTKKEQIFLKLSSPDDESLVFDSDLLVQGKTAPGVQVILSIGDLDLPVDLNKEGEFAQTVNLSEKQNQIYVTAFDKEGNNLTEKRSVYYSVEKL